MQRTFWLVVGMAAVFSLLFMQAQMHRMGGAVIAPHLQFELGLGAGELGLIIGVMFMASAATQPVSGVLLDRFGPVRAVSAMSPLAIGGMVLFATADSVAELAIARALIGAGFACVVSGLYVFLLGWVERRNFTTAAATVQALPGTASVLVASTPLAVGLATLGREPVFLALAGSTLIFVVLVALTVREGPLSKRAQQEPQSIAESFAGIALILRHRGYLWLAAFSMSVLGPSFSVIGLLSGVYLRERFALDPTALGNAVLALLIALNLGGVIYGPLDRLSGRRKLVVAGGVGVQVVMLVALAALGGFLGFWPTLALLAAFAAFSQLHALVIAHAQSLFGTELAGRVITTTNLFMIGGIFIFQFGSGLSHDLFTQVLGTSETDGYRLTFAALAMCQVVGLTLYRFVPIPTPAER
ncbi:MAG: MFS transporter [Pseudomonadota bacterium]